MEHVEGFHLLASTYKLDRLSDNSADAEGSTTTGVTIELGEYHTIEVQTIVELLGGIDSILTSHRVDDKQRLVRLDSLFQGCYLVHHLLIDSQTTSGIDDDDVIVLLLGFADSILGNLYNVLVVWLRINGYANALAHNVQLLDSGRTIDVAGYEQGILVLLGFQHVSQFTREGGLTRTLQTRHQHDGRTTFELQFYGLATHQFSQLIVNNLHHQLTGLDSGEYIHAQGLLLDGIGKLLGDLVVDVGIQQGLTNVLQGLRNVNLGDFSLTFQYLERTFKSFT